MLAGEGFDVLHNENGEKANRESPEALNTHGALGRGAYKVVHWHTDIGPELFTNWWHLTQATSLHNFPVIQEDPRKREELEYVNRIRYASPLL